MNKPYRYNKNAANPNIVYGRDLTIGYATLKHDIQRGVSGWALPGRRFTANSEEAERIALAIHNMIASRGGLPRDWMSSKRGDAA